MSQAKHILSVGDVVKRHKTRDVAFQFRMFTGYPGDIDRSRHFIAEPAQNNAANPLDFYGNAVLVNSADNTVRKVLTSDSAITTIYGIGVRPFPTQQTTGGTTASFGAAPVNTTMPLDVLRLGYFMSKLVGTATKGQNAYLWIAASSGSHVLGGFEAASSSGNTVQLANVWINGPAGSDGVAEFLIDIH